MNTASMSSHDPFEQKEISRAKRREKKRKPVMKMTGKGMKRFAKPTKPTQTR